MRIAIAMLAAAWATASPDPSYPSDGRGLSEVDAAVDAAATAFGYSRRLFAGEQQWNDTVPFYGKRRGVGRHGRSPSPPGKMAGRGRTGHASFRGLGRAKARGNLRDALARRGRGRGRGRPLTDVDRHGPTGRRETQRGDAPPDPKDIGCTASTKGLQLPWAAQGGLPQLPVRRGEPSAALPSYQTTRPKKCAILVDRHVHKNGGSTIRDFLLEQERLGYALYQGYTQLYWRNLFSKLHKVVTGALEAGSAPQMVMLIEAHFGWVEMNGPVLKDLEALRGQLRGHDCPIVTTTRVREPLDFYLSFYQWGVAFRQKEAPGSFGRNFEEWARMLPNLQSTMLLHSMSASDAEYHPLSYARAYGAPRIPAETLLRQTQQFLRRFDIVATMQRFDEHMLMVADAVGLPFTLYKRNLPNKKGGYKKVKSDVCPDMDKCRAIIKEIAPVDHQVYDEFHPAFEKRVAALGPGFAARVAEYKIEVAKAQDVWKGALRKQFLCRYHPEESPKVWKLRESNLRCPIEGAAGLKLCQAAYAYRTFECPWQYHANTSYTDPMGCWRPSTGFK
jgi:hypothetical protein